MRLFTRVGYRPKRIEKKEQSDGLLHLLALSVAGLCACLICLCGASWAWFTATTSTGTTAIQAAKYTVDVDVSVENGSEKIAPQSGTTTFTFPAEGSYIVKLTPNGTAKNGYCKIEFAGGPYYTDQLPSDGLSFTVDAKAGSELTVIPQWGTCTYNADLSNNGTIGSTPSKTAQPESVTGGE